MAVVFRSGDEPVAATDAWRHILDDTLGPLDPFGAVPDHVTAADIGAVSVAELAARGPGGARRTLRHVRRLDRELYKVDVVADGHGVIEQDGRRAALESGDLALVDLSRPARWAMSSGVRCVAVVFPPAMLPLPRDRLASLTAVRIPREGSAGALASSFARQVVGQLDSHAGAHSARLGTALLDLITMALAAVGDHEDEVPSETPQRALLLRMLAFVEERLGDPELTPRTIADAHHVSIRYLHRLFETQETSAADWIRRRRLERCRRDLLDPVQRALPVNVIAARWGLINAAHFSRAFRAAYGASPSEYRQAARGEDRPRLKDAPRGRR
jgi:AraC-like DNA-binding protein